MAISNKKRPITKFTLGHYEYIFKYFICFPRGALKCINFKSHLAVITINLNLYDDVLRTAYVIYIKVSLYLFFNMKHLFLLLLNTDFFF